MKAMKIEEQYEKLFKYCYMKTRDKHVAEDITQETFLRFLSNHSYKEMGKQMSYLYTIARNLCIDYFRKKPEYELDENMPYISSNENSLIEEALDKLNEEERELLFLRYTNEVSINDLSKHYEVSRFVINRRIKKALSHLKEVYEDEG